MQTSLRVLMISTQPWPHVARLAARLLAYGAALSAICPDEGQLAGLPQLQQRFRFHVSRPFASLIAAIEASRAERLVPADDFSVWLLHDLADQFPKLRPLVERSLGAAEGFPTLRSRFRLLSLAQQLGIAVPETGLLRNAGDLAAWCREHAGPYVLKRDGTWGGQGVAIAETAAEAAEAAQALRRPNGLGERTAQWLRNGDGSAFARPRCLRDAEVTVQGFVEGTPANAMYACENGKILAEVQARVAVSRGRTGPSLAIQIMRDARIRRAAELLAGRLRLSGFFGLDFILDAAGRPMLLELNPRATQLGHVPVASQADLAGSLWAHWTGREAGSSADPSLGDLVFFHPDGAELTRASASLASCRPDMPPADADRLAGGMVRFSSPRARVRRRLWTSLAGLKGKLRTEEVRQPFFYLDGQSDVEARPYSSRKEPTQASAPTLVILSAG